MNPGYAVSPGGWSTPADVIPDLLIPRRGGMRYPARQKENTMAAPMGRTARAALENEKTNALELIAKLQARVGDLDEKLAEAYPAEPGPGHDRFSVKVKFEDYGKEYEFLLLRNAGRWFTTGTSKQTQVFRNWAALVDWLQGQDVFWHSDLQRLKLDNVAWNLGSGELAFNDLGEDPF